MRSCPARRMVRKFHADAFCFEIQSLFVTKVCFSQLHLSFPLLLPFVTRCLSQFYVFSRDITRSYAVLKTGSVLCSTKIDMSGHLFKQIIFLKTRKRNTPRHLVLEVELVASTTKKKYIYIYIYILIRTCLQEG